MPQVNVLNYDPEYFHCNIFCITNRLDTVTYSISQKYIFWIQLEIFWKKKKKNYNAKHNEAYHTLQWRNMNVKASHFTDHTVSPKT